VILLQRSEFEYHFSARLQPWVHYVPLSHSTADVVAKLRWLRSHDALAWRIAENAANFARSHLRLEDHYCYLAHLLKALGRVQANSSSLKPFHPQAINSTSMAIPFEVEAH